MAELSELEMYLNGWPRTALNGGSLSVPMKLQEMIMMWTDLQTLKGIDHVEDLRMLDRLLGRGDAHDMDGSTNRY